MSKKFPPYTKWQMGSHSFWVMVVCLSAGTTAAHGQAGIITTVAGRVGTRGFGGDGGLATAASLSLANLQNSCDPGQFEQASHIAVDSNGNLFIADGENQRIRRVSVDGLITTVAGTGEKPAVNARCEPTGSVADGPAAGARFFNPADVELTPSGNLIIADEQNNRIRQVTAAGVASTISGNGSHNLYAPGVPAVNSPMDWPSAIAVDALGLVYFSELHGNRIGRIEASGLLSVIAGTGFPGFSGDNGPANAATLRKAAGVAIGAGGALLIADTGNHRIRRVSAGVITTIAGNGQASFCGDGGPAAQACLNTPMDVRADAAGNIYVADTGNHRVRKIDAAGNISTLAGTGIPGWGPDGVDASKSQLNYPAGLAVDAKQDLYVVDWQNYVIRKISFGSSPVVTSAGVVNGASFTSPVAPGSIFSIFGANLSASTEIATSGAWPLTLAGASVAMNGVAVPLYVVSPSQINGQVPVEMTEGTASLVVTTGAGASTAVPVAIAAAAPGFFLYPGTTRAISANQDGGLNSPDNPESAGRLLVFYLTGQGPVSPALGTGESASLVTLSNALLARSATIGGVNAPIQFLGLSPGFIGLAQANIVIPNDAPKGPDIGVILTVGGRQSNVALVAVR